MYITVNNTNYYIVDIRVGWGKLHVMLTTDGDLVSIYQRLWENEHEQIDLELKSVIDVNNILKKFPVYMISCSALSDVKHIINKLSINKKWEEHFWYDESDVVV